MRDYTKQTNLSSIENIVTFAVNKGYDVITGEGSLNDLHIIVNANDLGLNKALPRRFIIIYPKFETMYSNTLWITMTDKIDLAKKFAEDYDVLDELEECL